MFAVSGEKLTMRIRRLSFEAMLRQVLHSHWLVTLQVNCTVYFQTCFLHHLYNQN